MTWDELITLAINTAVAGTDADNNPVVKQRLEAGGMTDQALQALATEVAGNPQLRARLERQSTITVTSGVGSIPAGMLTEYLREGVARFYQSGETGNGVSLSRYPHLNTFLFDTNTLLGGYCIASNQFYVRQPGLQDYTQVNGSLVADAPFTPTAADLSTTVPDELTNDLVEILARRLRGQIAPAVSPA